MFHGTHLLARGARAYGRTSSDSTAMAVTVKLFAGLRERAGWSERELEGVARVADVWPALGSM